MCVCYLIVVEFQLNASTTECEPPPGFTWCLPFVATTFVRPSARSARFFDHLSNLQLLAALAYAHAPLVLNEHAALLCTHALVVSIADDDAVAFV